MAHPVIEFGKKTLKFLFTREVPGALPGTTKLAPSLRSTATTAAIGTGAYYAPTGIRYLDAQAARVDNATAEIKGVVPKDQVDAAAEQARGANLVANREEWNARWEEFKGAGGKQADLNTALTEWKAEQDAISNPLEKKAFKDWAPQWIAQKNEYDKAGGLEKIWLSIKKMFSTPGSFGLGSALGALGAGVAGYYAGGTWMAVPLALAGGLFGEKILTAFTGPKPPASGTVASTAHKPNEVSTSIDITSPGAALPRVTPPPNLSPGGSPS